MQYINSSFIYKIICIMKRIFVWLFFLTFLLTSCASEEGNKNNAKNNKKIEVAGINQIKLTNFCTGLRNGAFMKGVVFKQDIIFMQFVKDYQEFKKFYPGPGASEKEYGYAFEKVSEVEKMMAEIPFKLLKKFPKAKAVRVVLPLKGKTYTVDMNRKTLEEFTGSKFDNLVNDFVKKYVSNAKERKTYFDKFVKTKSVKN